MIVLDCFPFHDEWEMLHARRVELAGLVTEHVLVEGDLTYQGGEKPFRAAESTVSRDRLTILAAALPTGPAVGTRVRERAQRETLWGRVGAAPPDALILFGDVDEIPSRSAVERAMDDPTGMYVCEQRFYCNAIDWQHPVLWYGTTIAARATLTNMTMMRQRGDGAKVLEHGGWHFSWCGGPDRFRRKLRSFGHDDYQDVWFNRAEECWRDGVAVDGARLIPVEVDESYPLAVRRGDLDHLRRPR